MNDLEKFIELYESFDIKLKPYIDSCTQNTFIFITNGDPEDNSSSFLNVTKISRSLKFDGYSCFNSIVEFDQDGKFIKQGVWE